MFFEEKVSVLKEMVSTWAVRWHWEQTLSNVLGKLSSCKEASENNDRLIFQGLKKTLKKKVIFILCLIFKLFME